MTLVYMLMEIRAVEQHKVFPQERLIDKSLRQCEDHWELFGMLNLYWNYLSPDLLDQLLKELILKESSFLAIGEEMEKYKTDLQNFRQRTTLKLFCQADTSTECEPPPGFQKMVIKHEWPDTVTLEDVEQFRQRYARPYAYSLQTCAIMLHSIKPGGGGGTLPVVGEKNKPPSVLGSHAPVLAKGTRTSHFPVHTSMHHVVPETTTHIPTGTINLHVCFVLN